MGRIAFCFLITCTCELLLLTAVTSPLYGWRLISSGFFFSCWFYVTAYYLATAKLRVE